MLKPVAEVQGVFLSEPKIFPDNRGTFNEWFKASEFEGAIGYPFDLQQSNISFSKKGVLRGLHFADIPPGQAKFVTCMSGAILDVVFDCREGSPTFGKWFAVELTAENRKSLYLPIGVAHGFLALEDATVAYLVSSEYEPALEHTIDPFSVGIDWPQADYILSDKDKEAPSLEEVQLPQFADCAEFEKMLREGWAE
ncbi:dTDP-4-dehydrorhamnose 3,5-epimerase [Corynebacterium sp. H130]|uniref:dTDP-4-dehydrorhamnose 3,5-epimerase n=1 Tax=Corynebacterium sp. H130 TaxID=3133444 RepID=UPI0030AE5E17